MTKEQIADELMELDGQLSGLCSTIEFVNAYTIDGIDASTTSALIGTIHTLENIAKTYYSKYSALSCEIQKYLKEVNK